MLTNHNAEMSRKGIPASAILTGSLLRQSGIDIPASPVPLVTD
jgi:hypothetical protein